MRCKISGDPTLSSLPLLSTFLKSYGRPYLGISPTNGADPTPTEAVERQADELVEAETRDKFKRMCEGYFETIAKKLVKEHLVCNPHKRLVVMVVDEGIAETARPRSSQP